MNFSLTMIVCTNCNHSNPEGALQCEACYQALPVLVKCPNCGELADKTKTFCGSCGSNLQPDLTITQVEGILPQNLVNAEVPNVPLNSPSGINNPILLHLQTQLEIELTLELAVVYIGKPNERIPPDIDVSSFPNADIVSRVHAAIHIHENKYYLEDLGSSNGTYLNQILLTAKSRHLLKSGDRISLGKGDRVTFIFQVFLI